MGASHNLVNFSYSGHTYYELQEICYYCDVIHYHNPGGDIYASE